MRTEFLCFTRGDCAKRVPIRNCWRSGEFITACISCSTKSRSCRKPMALRGRRFCRRLRRRAIEGRVPRQREAGPPEGGLYESSSTCEIVRLMPSIPLLISAGEASGDMYAARLAAALKARLDVDLFGMGGPQMRAAGVGIVTDYSEVAVVGITEIVKHLPSLLRAMDRLVAEAEQRRPALAILTDFPGFHLRLARKLKPMGIRNVYYICPQFWAWRPWRANLVRRRVAKALCIFPFGEEVFFDACVATEIICHSLVGAVHATKDRKQFCEEQNLDASRSIVTLLPGSRGGELTHHLPVLREACLQINGREQR